MGEKGREVGVRGEGSGEFLPPPPVHPLFSQYVSKFYAKFLMTVVPPILLVLFDLAADRHSVVYLVSSFLYIY